MLYIFILPAFAFTFLILFIVTVVAYFSMKYRIYFPIAWRLLLGITSGFLVFNVLFWIVTIGAILILDTFDLPPSFRNVEKIVVVGGLILGPFVASVLGVLAGAMYTWRNVWGKSDEENHGFLV